MNEQYYDGFCRYQNHYWLVSHYLFHFIIFHFIIFSFVSHKWTHTDQLKRQLENLNVDLDGIKEKIDVSMTNRACAHGYLRNNGEATDLNININNIHCFHSLKTCCTRNLWFISKSPCSLTVWILSCLLFIYSTFQYRFHFHFSSISWENYVCLNRIPFILFSQFSIIFSFNL